MSTKPARLELFRTNLSENDYPDGPKKEMFMQKLGIKQKIYESVKLKTRKGDLGKNDIPVDKRIKNFHTKVRDKGI